MCDSKDPKNLEPQVLDALKFICESNRSLHEGRIGRELTLVISIIPFFIVSAGFAIMNINGMNSGQTIALAIAALIGYLGLFWAAFIHLHTSAQANLRNQRLAEIAEDEIIRFLKDKKFSDKVSDISDIGEFLKGFPTELFVKYKKFDDLLLKYAKRSWWIKILLRSWWIKILLLLRWERKSLLEEKLKILEKEELKKILNEKKQQGKLNQQQMRGEEEWEEEDFHPARQRWFLYVRIVGLTAVLCYLLILVFVILHFCITKT